MFDLLTTEEDEAAAKQGWQLTYVFDPRTKRTAPEILPSWTHPKVKTKDVATRVAVAMAHGKNDPVAKRAVQLVMRKPTGAKK